MSVYPTTEDKTRSPDVELHNKSSCVQRKKRRVISALYAAQALGDHSAWWALIFLFLHQCSNLSAIMSSKRRMMSNSKSENQLFHPVLFMICRKHVFFFWLWCVQKEFFFWFCFCFCNTLISFLSGLRFNINLVSVH